MHFEGHFVFLKALNYIFSRKPEKNSRFSLGLVNLGLSRYIGLLVYCDISLKRYTIWIWITYRDISLLL